MYKKKKEDPVIGIQIPYVVHIPEDIPIVAIYDIALQAVHSNFSYRKMHIAYNELHTAAAIVRKDDPDLYEFMPLWLEAEAYIDPSDRKRKWNVKIYAPITIHYDPKE